MKIIDLLNKIANGETVLFKYRDITYYYNYDFKEYISTQKYYRQGDIIEHYFLLEEIDMTNLNDEVEILEEEKKIPKKLEEIGIQYNLGYIDYKNIETLKECLNKDFQTIYDTIDLIIKNQNKLIDYLKSKGE